MTLNNRRPEVRVERNGGGGEADRNPQPAQLDRALENQLASNNRLRWTLRQEINPGQHAEELAKRLDNASHLLVDRLFDYLSNIPENESSRSTSVNGLTLPASAIGWLSTQMYPRSNESDPVGVPTPSESAWMGASMRDRLALLKYLLPRATHLRIINEEWPPPTFRKNKSLDRTTDFVGRDVGDLSHLSVHSGVTMETSFIGATPNIQSFLIFYNQMQNRPRVDLQVFPNLSVLFLERVPPEWVVNLHTLHGKIKLIRSEQGCIFDMTRFLFGGTTDVSGEDTLSEEPRQLKELAYLKLNNSGLGEMSGLRGRRRGTPKPQNASEEQHDVLRVAPPTVSCPPPLSRLPNLISLSLARNEIRTVKTALAGLSSLSNLSRLDLSFNRLRTMKGANQMLGNIKTLILTGNSLQNVSGLDKLYSLETLLLDQNQFEDLTDIAGLGKLPELMSLFLHDNPFIEKDPIRYRVSVLDLFKSTRFYALLAGATYRHLLQILPMLDGAPATKRELVGLRSLTFRRVIPPVEAPPPVLIDKTVPESVTGNQADIPTQSQPATEQFKTTSAIRPRRVTRKVRKGKAIVRDGTGVNDCNTESIKKLKSSLESKPLDLRKIEFSAQDVISSLVAKPEKGKKAPKANADKQGTPVTVESRNGQDNRSFASLSTVSQTEGSVHDIVTKTDTLIEQAQAAIEAADASNFEDDKANLLDNYSAASLVPRIKEAMETKKSKDASPETVWEEPQERIVAPVKQHGNASAAKVGKLELKRDDSKTWMNSPGKVGKVELKRDDRKAWMNSPGRVGKVKLQRNNSKSWIKSPGFDDITPRRATTAKSHNSFSNPFDDDELVDAPGSPSKILSFNVNAPTAVIDYLPRPSVGFPERVWDDSVSVTSSLGTGRISGIDFPAEDKYRDAEDTSIYDGPEGYKKVSVTVNLELYFRLFVFPTKDPDIDTNFDLDDDMLSKVTVEASPRIQLRPVDRKVAAKSVKDAVGSAKLMMGLRETFKKVLQEEIIACGKSAARRVTPHKKLRRGFHGDPAFSDGSIGFSAESRNVVICTSDAAIYIIPDYDSVSMKLVEQSTGRKFPSPIPQQALFQNGVWPHALARLPIDTLHRITIGFAFQRLTLHFAPSSEVERSVLGNALTFILVTSDRMATVKLLQHLQDLTKEAEELAPGKFPHAVVIDNDDKQVLESLSVAVAPFPIDVVLHYQVLQQRWKHGDRGTVRRACVITDSHIFLLDEDYVGDGSESYDAGSRTLGEIRYNLVDSAELSHIVEVQAASEDPKAITIVVAPPSRLQRNHNWRLYCRDGSGAERLVEDARKAMSSVSDEMQIS